MENAEETQTIYTTVNLLGVLHFQNLTTQLF